MIVEKLNENNIKKLLESNLKQERIIRILSKRQKMKQNHVQTKVKEYIFNIQNEENKEKEENREKHYPILY